MPELRVAGGCKQNELVWGLVACGFNELKILKVLSTDLNAAYEDACCPAIRFTDGKRCDAIARLP